MHKFIRQIFTEQLLFTEPVFGTRDKTLSKLLGVHGFKQRIKTCDGQYLLPPILRMATV